MKPNKEDGEEKYYLITLTNGEQHRAWWIGVGYDFEKGKIVSDRTMLDFGDKAQSWIKKYPVDQIRSIIIHPSGEDRTFFGRKPKNKEEA